MSGRSRILAISASRSSRVYAEVEAEEHAEAETEGGTGGETGSWVMWISGARISSNSVRPAPPRYVGPSCSWGGMHAWCVTPCHVHWIRKRGAYPGYFHELSLNICKRGFDLAVDIHLGANALWAVLVHVAWKGWIPCGARVLAARECVRCWPCRWPLPIDMDCASATVYHRDRAYSYQIAERVQIIRNVGADDDVKVAYWVWRPCFHNLRPRPIQFANHCIRQ